MTHGLSTHASVTPRAVSARFYLWVRFAVQGYWTRVDSAFIAWLRFIHPNDREMALQLVDKQIEALEKLVAKLKVLRIQLAAKILNSRPTHPPR